MAPAALVAALSFTPPTLQSIANRFADAKKKRAHVAAEL